MFGKYYEKFLSYFGWSKNRFHYPVNERQYEKNPTKPRTSEMSQLQDEMRDIETRSPEREVFEDHTYQEAIKELEHPGEHADQAGANPTR